MHEALAVSDEAWVAVVGVPRGIRRLLAANVRRERERAGLSREALGATCDLGRGTVARIERAEHEPRISTLIAFSVALDVPLRAFIDGLPEGGLTNPGEQAHG